jgi:hypothetical protein
MGLRFRKSISIAPGVRINLNKKSASVSVGNKFGGVSYNTRTGARARVSAPGTGLSYSTKIGSSTNVNSNTSTVATVVYEEPRAEKNKWVAFVLCCLFGWLGAHKVYEGKTKKGLLYLFTFGLFGFGWMFDIIALLCKPTTYYI